MNVSYEMRFNNKIIVLYCIVLYCVVLYCIVTYGKCREKSFVPYNQNLALIGQVVLEKMFEIVDGRRRMDNGAWVCYKLTFE